MRKLYIFNALLKKEDIHLASALIFNVCYSSGKTWPPTWEGSFLQLSFDTHATLVLVLGTN